MKTRPLSYDLVNVRGTSGSRFVARIWCAQCGDTLDLTLTGSHHADDVERRARAKGWDCDKNRPAVTCCPDCKSAPRKPRKGRPTASTSAPIITKPAIMKKEITMTTTTVRVPTPDERMRVRRKLDEVFDDAKGMYLDGYSDQRLAEELNLPRKIVELIREAAYGPIRTDSEVEQLRGDIAELTAKAAAMAGRLAEIEKRFLSK